MLRLALHAVIFLALTVLTQIGGLAWLLACLVKRRVLSFIIAYAALSVATTWVAPAFGRVALSCFDQGPLQVQSWLYCGLNRTYVSPELSELLHQTAEAMDDRYPGTITLVLDANFPFFDGFPLLPHLSHDDGEKADLAFYYRDETGYLPGATRSPIGYFAFEQGPTNCTPVLPTLRWDFDALQPLWADYDIEPDRMREVLRLLSNDPRVGRIFIEPHLVTSLGATHPNIGFQGCLAARHDDHIHLQLR